MQNTNTTEAQRLEEAGHWLMRLREDALGDADALAWVEWCEADPRNLQAFESLQTLWNGAQRRPDPATLARLLQADEPPPRRPADAGRRGWRASLNYALAASLVALVPAASQHLFDGGAATRARTVAVLDSLQTPLATNQHSQLPDGSGIDVGARSVVDIDFTHQRRRLQLRQGEAFFKVKHDPGHPFVVEAGGVQFTAVGTAFDVKRSGSEVTVTVQEGLVRVSRGGADGAAPVAETAGAGYQVAIDTQSGGVRRSIVDAGAVLAWREGRLEFSGDKLEVVLAAVNRYSERPIVLADPALGQLSFTGTIFFGSIDAWLDGLQQVFPVTVDRSAGDRIVLGRAAEKPKAEAAAS